MSRDPDIQAGRLNPSEYEKGFSCSMYEDLNLKTAKIEASRCYFCHDAPCIEACPTDIDIPLFIKKISTENVKGAAIDILSQNIMGGTCARVCPVESLCEGACVRNTSEDKPVTIGLLQKFATDDYFDKRKEHPFKREKSTGKKIAVIGSGPAGLSCAHRLARYGHDVVVYEAKQKPGGLNEYGIAPYKMVEDFAQQEVEFIKEIGGIEIEYDIKLGDDITIEDLQKKYDAVFLGIGLSDVNSIGIPGEDFEGVTDAVDYISQIRQCEDISSLPIGKKVVVIGGGSTAIDIAVQSKRLGAEQVTMVYRRGEDQMSATWKERQFAQKNGILIETWLVPKEIRVSEKYFREVEFEKGKPTSDGKIELTGEKVYLQADMVFKAIGQKLSGGLENIELEGRKIKVNPENFSTSISGVFAGGDCVKGNDLTVVAVEQGQKAATGIHNFLIGGK